MNPGEDVSFDIVLNSLANKLKSTEARQKSVIVIEIENEILDLGQYTYKDVLSVSSKYEREGINHWTSGQGAHISPSLVVIDGAETIYHYLIYDLCDVDA